MKKIIILALLGFCNTAVAETLIDESRRVLVASPVEQEIVVERLATKRCLKYATVDRPVLKSILLNTAQILNRMNEFAYFLSYPQPYVQINLTQRLAFNNELQALLHEITRLGSELPPNLRPITRTFIQHTVNTDYLSLTGTTVSGATDAEAQANSEILNTATTDGVHKLWECF